MIIDHESKFIFVAVAKTACTSIHRSFENTQDPEPNIYHMHLKDIILIFYLFQSNIGIVRRL